MYSGYRALTRVVTITWLMYPLLWAVADGSRTVDWQTREVASNPKLWGDNPM